MFVVSVRIVSGLLFVPALLVACFGLMADPKSFWDWFEIYLLWLVPALCGATAWGIWVRLSWQYAIPTVLFLSVLLPALLWLVFVLFILLPGSLAQWAGWIG